MNSIRIIAGFLFFAAAAGYAGMESKMKKAVDSRGRKYFQFENDPFQVRIMTLGNGLKLVMSKNPLQPSASVLTAVRAGSTDEPPSSTGLAHYFEHMMFKGTPEIGALNWEKEKPLLERISQLFEERRNESDPEKQKKIYQEIDRLSGEAAKYASASEYSKLMTAIGANDLNAATSYDYTVYHATVPVNELDRLLELEAKRFRDPVLRLFHTELETVYEEFNRGQDNDSRRCFNMLLSGLHPVHPAGRNIIGKPEHLKYPSMNDIHTFFRKYYVPGNMMLVIIGDLDYEATADLAERTLGTLPPAPVPVRNVPADPVPEKEQRITLKGPDKEYLMLGWRIPNTPENTLSAQILTLILSDNGYGVFDQELILPQKVLQAKAGLASFREYLDFLIEVRPLKGQTLDEAEKEVRKVLAKVIRGEYESWRIGAIAANTRVELARYRDSDPMDMAWGMTELFTNGMSYWEWIKLPDRIEKTTQSDLAAFVGKYLKNGIVVRKITGKADDIIKVKKPAITPVELNAGTTSPYAQKFLKRTPAFPIHPDIPDPERDILEIRLPSGATLEYIRKNSTSGVFTLRVQSDTGKRHNNLLPLAADFFQFAGTEKRTAAEFRQELYKSGLQCHFSSDTYHTTAELSGPGKSLKRGVELLQEILRSPRADQAAYDRFAEMTLKQRKDKLLNPKKIFSMAIYRSLYGENNPIVKELIPEAQLKSLAPQELLSSVGTLLTSSNIRVVYAGPDSPETVQEILSGFRTEKGSKAGTRRRYDTVEVTEPTVYLVPADTVQFSVGFTTSCGKYDPENAVLILLYNTYFAEGLNSVIFNEIRESRALAYSASGHYGCPEEKNRNDILYITAGTQPDKLEELIRTTLKLLSDMPEQNDAFLAAKDSVRKTFEARRFYGITLAERIDVFKRLGVDAAWSRRNYDKIQSSEMKDLAAFAAARIGKRKFNIVIAGDISRLDRKALSEFGTVQELTLKDIFGY